MPFRVSFETCTERELGIAQLDRRHSKPSWQGGGACRPIFISFWKVVDNITVMTCVYLNEVSRCSIT